MKIFPDTNIFLHFVSIEQIAFDNIIPGYNPNANLQIVLAPVVIKELDNHKWSHPNTKIRERASSVTKKLLSWVDLNNGVIRENLHLSIGYQPTKEKISEFGLDINSNDDLYLASVISEASNGSEEVFVLSNDTGVNLKCISLKMKRIQLPDSCLLPPTADPGQREIEKLKKELEKIKNAVQRPELKILFKKNRATLEPKILPLKIIDERWVQSELAKEKLNFPHLNPYAMRLNLNPAFGGPLVEPDPEATKRYNKEVEEYLPSFEAYLRKNIEVENAAKLILKIEFELDNSGTGVAEDARAYLTVPSNITWLEGEDNFPSISKPKRPERPKNAMEKLASFGQDRFSHFPISMLRPEINQPEKNVTSWVKGDDLCFSIKKCLHHHSIYLGTGYIFLKSESEVKPFQIEYMIVDKDNPEPHRGNLLVKPVFAKETDQIEQEEDQD